MLRTKQNKSLVPGLQNAGVGFVSFESATLVPECLSDPRVIGTHYDWTVAQAPPPQDILWMNIHVSKSQRLLRATFFNIMLVIVSIFLSKNGRIETVCTRDVR